MLGAPTRLLGAPNSTRLELTWLDITSPTLTKFKPYTQYDYIFILLYWKKKKKGSNVVLFYQLSILTIFPKTLIIRKAQEKRLCTSRIKWYIGKRIKRDYNRKNIPKEIKVPHLDTNPNRYNSLQNWKTEPHIDLSLDTNCT